MVEVLLYVHRNRKLIRDVSPGRPFRFSHSVSVLVEVLLYVHRNRRRIKDGESWTATSTFTQLLSSEEDPLPLRTILFFTRRNKVLL